MKLTRIVAVIIVTLFWTCNTPDTPIYTAIWKKLDDLRTEKKGQLERYLLMVTQKAHSIQTDTLMCNFFRIKREFFQLSKTVPPPPALVKNIERLKQNIEGHYLNNYLLFYDILFIDTNGDIFYTLRKQADYHKNIFSRELAQSTLARRLREGSKTAFVDYSYYTVSDEPSAFIIEPFLDGDKLLGWFVLQNAINKINSMFSYEKELGTTGEVFLVNKMHAMLTDSRFMPHSTILKKQLSAKNIEDKFKERQGHKIVNDYRGFRTMSSFEVVTLPGSEWLLVAKIDEDEVITDHFSNNKKGFFSSMLQTAPPPSRVDQGFTIMSNHRKSVDMDEFIRVDSGICITTNGVSTCTAVIISMPKRFSYMAHVSPYDQMYGGSETDLLGHMMKRIYNLDIYPYEKRDLQFTVISPSQKVFAGILEYLITQGVFLSQITMVCRNEMRYVNVAHDCALGITTAEWIPKQDEGNHMIEFVNLLPTLGDLARTTIPNAMQQ